MSRATPRTLDDLWQELESLKRRISDMASVASSSAPFDALGWMPTGYLDMTSASFVTCAEAAFVGLGGDVIYMDGAVYTDGTTTGEVRVRWIDGDGNTGSLGPLAIPINTNGTALFSWLHGLEVGFAPEGGLGGALYLFWEARRVSGAGTFRVYHPRHCTNTSSRILDAASDGDPTLA